MAATTTLDHVTTQEDTSIAIKNSSLSLLGSRPGTLKLTSVGNATHGSVSLVNGKIVFRPDADFSGIADFDYTVTDTNGLSKTATFKVDVAPVADAAILSAEQPIAQKVGGEFLVNTTTAGGQFQTSVATLTNGDYVIAWTDTSYSGGDEDGDSVKARIFHADGTAGPEFLVNTETASSQRQPTLTALVDGGFVVAWEDNSGQGGDADGSSVKAQIYNTDGSARGGEFLVNATTDGSQDAASIGALSKSDSMPDGGFVVAWEDASTSGPDGDGSVKAQMYDVAGHKIGGEILVNTVTQGWQGAPSVTGLKNGGFVVSWEDDSGLNRDGEVSSIKAQVYDAHGVPVGGEILVNNASARWQDASSITALSNGGFVVTWEAGTETGPDDRDSAIRAQVFNEKGEALGDEILVNTTTKGFQLAPSTTALTGGRFVVVWEDDSGFGGDDSDHAIKAQVFDTNGEKLGGEFLVNTVTADDQRFPSVAATLDGGFIVSWSDASGVGGDTDGFGAKAQIFTLGNCTENTALKLNVSAALTDSSESLTLIVSGIPPGATLSDGVNTSLAGADSVDISGWNFANLTVNPPHDFTGEFKLTFAATSTDSAHLSSGDASNSKTVTQTVEILVVPGGAVNRGPTDEVLAGGLIAENSINGAVVGTVKGIDSDAGSVLSYTLTDNAGGRFAINKNTGEITVANGSLLDFEAASSHGIKVQVTDQGGLSFEKSFTITVTDVNEAPIDEILSGGSVAENSANGTVVGTVKAIDPDAGSILAYTLIDNAGGRFAIDQDSGVITVRDGTLLDFETATSQDIKVRVTDQGGLTFDKTFTIAVTDVLEGATDELLTGGTVAENSANGTVVGTVQAVDPDKGAIFSFTLTNDAGGRFAIDANTGVITVQDGTLLDFEATSSHGISVRVTDQAGAFFDKNFTVHLTDVNEAPTNETLSNNTVAENSANGTVVGTVHGIDPDAGTVLTYALTNDAGGRFTIDANTGVITVLDGTLLDFETATSHNVSVRVTDQGGLSFDKDFTIQVLNVHEGPTGETLSGGTVAENSANGTVVGAVHGIDPDAGAVLTYSLLDNAGGRFAIDANTGVITVANGLLLDFETARLHNIAVRVTDQLGSFVDQSFTINVSNVVEVPVAANGHVPTTEDTAVVVTAASLVANSSDPEGNPLSVTAVGNPSHGTVSLVNGSITFTPAANFSGIASFDYTLSDGQGSSSIGTVTVDVSPVADTPLLSAQQVLTSRIGGQIKLNTTAIGGQFRPSIAQLTNGSFVAAWTDTSRTGGDGDDSIRAQLFDANGNKVGNEFIVNTTRPGAQNNSKLTALAGGGFVVTWEDASGQGGDASGLSVKAQVFDGGGNKVGGEILANTSTLNDQDDRTIAALSDGGFVIAWDDASGQGGDASGTSIKAQRFDANGNRVNGEFLVNTSTANSQQFPSIAGLASGGFVITWGDNSGTGGDPDGSIKAQRYNADGSRAGGEFLVNTQTGSLQTAPFVTGLKNGGFIVAWKDFSGLDGDTSQGAVKAQIFDSAGSKVGHEFLVNTTTINAQQQPVIAELGNGDIVIAWTDFSGLGGDDSGTSLKAQIFSPNGAKIGGEFLVNKSISGDQKDPTITASGSNGFIVAWSDGGTAGGVQAQTFTLASTLENTALPLNVTAAVTDIDGSERLTLGVSGIPVGATLSDGVRSFTAVAGTTSVDISTWSLGGLTITPPSNFTGDFQLTFNATATDNADLSTGPAPSVSKTVSQTIDVIVSPGIATGGTGNDVLQGGAGNDVLTGNGGNDTYIFARGGGQDRIVNGAPGNASPSGELDFGANIGTGQLWFQQNGNDLTVDIMGTQDKIAVSNWFSAPSAQLQEIKTADGSRLDNTNSNISQLVQAMASYSSNHTGFDPTTVTQAPNDPTLQNAITAAWHA